MVYKSYVKHRTLSFSLENDLQELTVDKGGKFLKELWCCVGGGITR